MVQQTFLHIGGEKTGTTTLQHFLSRNARRLRRQGFYYPSESNNICFHNKGHFPVAACLIDGDVDFVSARRQLPASRVLGALRSSCLSTDKSLVLSCEHFSSRLRDTQQLEALRNALPLDDIKIVFYAREPSELALAAWSTSVRCGARHPFDPKRVVPANRYFNHLATLDLWASVFGRENMIVREYDRDRLVGDDIRWDFCRLLGVDLANPHLDENENSSFDVQQLEVLRLINSALPLFDESPTDWLKSQQIRNAVARSIPLGAPLKSLMSKQDVALIKSRFRDVHEELSERYFDGRLSDKWFPTSETDAESDATSERLETTELLQALRDTIIRLAETAHEPEYRRQRSRRTTGITRKLVTYLNALKKRRRA